MAISIRGGAPVISAGAGNPTSVSLTGTQQPQTDDVLLIIHGNDFYALSNIPTPTVGGSTSGVTAVTNGAGDAGTNGAHVKAFTKVITSTGDVTVSVTETGTADEEKVLVVWVLSGVDTSTPVDVASNGASLSSASTFVLPAVTATGTNDFLVVHVNTGGGITITNGVWSAGTEDYDTSITGLSYSGAHEQLSSSGSTGSRTFDPNGAEAAGWAGVLVTLKTASATAPANVARPIRWVPWRPQPTPLQLLGDSSTPPVIVRAQGGVISAAATADGVRIVPADPNQAVPQIAWMFLQPSGIQLAGDRSISVTVKAEAGQAPAAGTSQATAVKVAKQGAVCSAAATSLATRSTAKAGAGVATAASTTAATAVKVARQSGACAVAAAGAATGRKVVAATGATAAAATGAATGAKKASAAGQTSAAAAAQASAAKKAPAAGHTVAAAAPSATCRKVTTGAGQTYGAAFAYRSIVVLPRAQSGTCATAGSAAARASKVAPATGSTAAATHARVNVVKRATPTGAACTASAAQASARKRGTAAATCSNAATTTANPRRIARGAGAAYALVFIEGRRRALSRFTPRPNTGTTNRPNSGTTPRPAIYT